MLFYPALTLPSHDHWLPGPCMIRRAFDALRSSPPHHEHLYVRVACNGGIVDEAADAKQSYYVRCYHWVTTGPSSCVIGAPIDAFGT